MARYYDNYDDFPQYVSAAERRRKAEREAAKLKSASPVLVTGTKIAKTFWGKAWCRNLESYSDYANRLPRGRTYVRSGCVVDLQIVSGIVKAHVSGSRLYSVEIQVSPIPKPLWEEICHDCAGAIDSLVELLEGRFSQTTSERLCRQKTGLFPTPSELKFNCTCPDWANMCKHVAAALYGIGARLDEKPGLLFTLRDVAEEDLITNASRRIAKPRTSRVLETGSLSELFEIDIVESKRKRRHKKTP
jgi:uncharacterized Zn finger protein